MAQSIAEAKFITTIADVNQAIWLRNILMDLCQNQDDSAEIFYDN